MNYTTYTWRTDAIVKTGYRDIKSQADKLIGAKRFLKKVHATKKGQERREFIRRFTLLNEFAIRKQAMFAMMRDGDEDEAKAVRGEVVSTLTQLAMEHGFRRCGGEAWYPESSHLLDVLANAEVNCHPEDLYDGQPWSVVINLPDDFQMEGVPEVKSFMVMLSTDAQACAMIQRFTRAFSLDKVVDPGCGDHDGGHFNVPLIHIATCTKDEYVVLDYPLENVAAVTRGVFQLRCVTQGNSYPIGKAREHDIWSHLNLAIRLIVYAKAFPEVVVPWKPEPKTDDGSRKMTTKRMVSHPRIKKDSTTVRFITYRKGYQKRAHEKVLRSERFRRNPDGSPRTVPVKSCWVPPVGYIGSRKMTVKELEQEAIERLQKVG